MSEQLVSHDTPISVLSLDTLRNLAFHIEFVSEVFRTKHQKNCEERKSLSQVLVYAHVCYGRIKARIGHNGACMWF